jgi:hypothetical protein
MFPSVIITQEPSGAEAMVVFHNYTSAAYLSFFQDKVESQTFLTQILANKVLHPDSNYTRLRIQTGTYLFGVRCPCIYHQTPTPRKVNKGVRYCCN